MCARAHTQGAFTLASSYLIHAPSEKLECGALVLIPRTLHSWRAGARKPECQRRPGTLPHWGADSCGIHRLNPPQ